MGFILSHLPLIILSFAIAYFLGSINTAVIVTSVVTKGKLDIRTVGSGNAGFTNVLRAVGKIPAIVTIICDLLKSVIAVLIGGIFFTIIAEGRADMNAVVTVGKYFCGFFCILGHSFPIYFHFKGGKGIVSAAGMMLTTDWRVFLIIVTTFLIVFICSKIISLASITCAALFPVYAFIMSFFIDVTYFNYPIWYVWGSVVAAALTSVFVIYRHKGNIERLRKGEEKKITVKK